MTGQPVKKRFPLVGAIVLGSVLVITLVLLAVYLGKSKITQLEVGADIPDFTVTSFAGDRYQKSQWTGRIILLNFWSSWCASCDEEGAVLEEVWQEVKASGDILFLGVNYVDTEKDSLAFLERYNITFPNAPDLGSRISHMFMVQAVPETYIIGRDGRLAVIQIGPFETADQIRQALKMAED